MFDKNYIPDDVNGLLSNGNSDVIVGYFKQHYRNIL